MNKDWLVEEQSDLASRLKVELGGPVEKDRPEELEPLRYVEQGPMESLREYNRESEESFRTA